MGKSGVLSYSYPSTVHPGARIAATRSIQHLDRYLSSPCHEPSIESFRCAADWMSRLDPAGERPLILDSGCGTGLSTSKLALARPDSIVIGVDRSELRLANGVESNKREVLTLPSNAKLVRAELATFWRLMIAERDNNSPLSASRVAHHYLLYPNPYPKSSRLKLRWHGHAAWPVLLSLGGTLELRSNWRTYLDEALIAIHACEHGASSLTGDTSGTGAEATRFAIRAAASRLAGAAQVGCKMPGPQVEELRLLSEADALTRFELKFHRARERLWRLRVPAWDWDVGRAAGAASQSDLSE